MSQATSFSTYNPHSGEPLKTYAYVSTAEALAQVEKAQSAFEKWSLLSVQKRIEVLEKIKTTMGEEKDRLAKQISLEMGKPLAQSVAEVEKSMSLIDFAKSQGPKAIEPRIYEGHQVIYQPLGIIYGVMPWNFPMWQVFRFAIPAMLSGNTVVLKHAESVMGTAVMMHDLIHKIFPGLLVHVIVSHETSEKIIADPRIRGVSLTGSTAAGKVVASQAGQNLKKCVLELGGNDAYVVLPDANLEYALQKTFEARVLNAGQSCISAKRVFVPESLQQKTLDFLKAKIAGIQVGDGFDASSQMGPLARKDLRDTLLKQVEKSVKEGAEIIYQKKISEDLKGFYFPPTLLANISETNSAFTDEFFGPVFSVITYKDEADALRLVNLSQYGLGGAVFSENRARAIAFAEKMETGSVAINDFFRSAPEKPFGGVKNSGYGRELGSEGFMEFVNVKSLITQKTQKVPGPVCVST